MKKTNLILLTILLITLFPTLVSAKTYEGNLRTAWWEESKVNVFAGDSTGYLDYNGWQIVSDIDDEVYYCIDPEYPVEGKHTYITGKENIINNSRLNNDTFTKINLLAYYGYGYRDSKVDHTAKKWYGITQVMMWNLLRSDTTWTFRTDRYGTFDSSLYLKEQQEMNNLIANHNKKPSFANKDIKLLYKQSIQLTDTNNILSKYAATSKSSNITIKLINNALTITAKENGIGHLKFAKNTYKKESFALLDSQDYQDVVARGNFEPITFDLNIEITGGIIKLQKLDEDTNRNIPQGEASLKDAAYEVYDEKNKKVGTIVTNELGKGEIVLDYGTYTVKETKAPLGYNLDEKEYKVTIDKNNQQINLNVTDKVKTGTLKITKLKGSLEEAFTKEKDAVFTIIDKDGNIVKEVTTNEEGMIETTLPFGTYKISQTKSEEGYVSTDDFEVNVTEDKIYEFEIKNIKLSKLILTKYDNFTKRPVSEVIFEVYDENDNLIADEVTDENGQIEIEDLQIGNYYILEKETLDYYEINEEKIPFEVTENGQVIRKELINNRKIANLEIIKTNDKKDLYLKDAYFKLYFTETNKLMYQGKTNKDGKILLNDLPLGNYCLLETEAPLGYIKLNKPVCFELNEGNKTKKIEVQNEKEEIEIDVPNTMKNKSIILPVASVSLLIIGITTIVYEAKIRKEKN